MIGRAVIQVFSRGWTILLAAMIALTIFVLTTWLGNLGLVWQIATSTDLPLANKVRILLALVGSITTNFTMFSAATTIAIAVLFGMNTAVMAYAYVEQRRFILPTTRTGTVASLGGLASGLFGIGCATCGTLFLGPALGLFGLGSFTALLPFGGEEFGALGALTLSLSLILSAKKIGQPMACQVTTNPTKFNPKEN